MSRTGRPPRNPTERFWEKVDVRGPDDCWEWQSGRDEDGYGRFRVGGQGSATVKAQRFAYEITIGSIPQEMLVCHTCDNPPCCNPRHLFVGTSLDNNADRDAKGRTARGQDAGTRGEQNGMSKLTSNTVREIRSAVLQGVSQAELSRKYQVQESTISRIVNHKLWSGLDRS